MENQPNRALHLTAIPLRSIAAGELRRYTPSNMSWGDLPIQNEEQL
jgi:hypothetical protein